MVPVVKKILIRTYLLMNYELDYSCFLVSVAKVDSQTYFIILLQSYPIHLYMRGYFFSNYLLISITRVYSQLKFWIFTFFYTNRKMYCFRKNSWFRFLVNQHDFECPGQNLTILRNCQSLHLSMCLWQTFCGCYNSKTYGKIFMNPCV